MGHSSIIITEKYYVQCSNKTFSNIKKKVNDFFNKRKKEDVQNVNIVDNVDKMEEIQNKLDAILKKREQMSYLSEENWLLS